MPLDIFDEVAQGATPVQDFDPVAAGATPVDIFDQVAGAGPDPSKVRKLVEASRPWPTGTQVLQNAVKTQAAAAVRRPPLPPELAPNIHTTPFAKFGGPPLANPTAEEAERERLGLQAAEQEAYNRTAPHFVSQAPPEYGSIRRGTTWQKIRSYPVGPGSTQTVGEAIERGKELAGAVGGPIFNRSVLEPEPGRGVSSLVQKYDPGDPIALAASRFATGMATPANLLFGAGAISRLSPGAKALVDTAFAASMARNLPTQIRQTIQAPSTEGKIAGGLETFASLGLTTALGLGAKRAVQEKVHSGAEDSLTDLLWRKGYVEDVNGQPIHVRSQAEARAVAKQMIEQSGAGLLDQFNIGRQASRAAENVSAREVGRPVAEPRLLTGEQEATRPAASVKMFITRADEAQLRALGYPEDVINKLAPGDAQTILAQRRASTSPVDQTAQLLPASSSSASPDMVSQAAAALARADRIDAGLPAEPPAPSPPPPPVPPPAVTVTAEMVQEIGRQIGRIQDPAAREQAMQEAHSWLAANYLRAGVFTDPHTGKLMQVRNPDQAEKVALDVINGGVERYDQELAAEVERLKTSAEGKKPAGEQKAAGIVATRAARRQMQAQPFESLAEELPAVESEHEPAVAQGPEATGAEPGPGGQATYGEAAELVPAPAAPAEPAQHEVIREEAPEPTHEVIREEAAPLQKGARVTLADGRGAMVEYSSPTMNLVRLRTEAGEKVAVSGRREIERLKPASDSTEKPTKFKLGSTQHNIAASSDAAKSLETARARISDSDLAGQGKDVDGNHVTVRYGIKGDDIEGIRNFLSQQEPFEATLGRTEKFPAARPVAPEPAKRVGLAKRVREKQEQQAALLREVYKPGNVVTSYGHAHDKVIEFIPGEASKPYPYDHWQVRVVESDAQGNPVPGARVRTHSTPPEKADVAAATRRLEAKAAAPEPAKPVATKPAAKPKRGERVTAKIGNQTYTGTYLGENEQGMARVRTGKLAEVLAAPTNVTRVAEPAREVIPTAKKEYASGERVAGHEGSETRLLTSDGERPAKYRVVEAADLTPSHDAQTFARNPQYPGGIQERAYDTSKEAQQRVIEQAQKYDPNYTINTNPDAVNGPPIITPDGVVLGGNSRAMSTQRLYRAGNGNRYKNALLAQAQTFGLEKEAIRSMREPVLVREVEAPKTVEKTRALASQLNKSMTGALGVTERAVSAGKAISRESLASISGMLDGLGEGASLRDLLRERGNEVLNALVKDGAITDRERPQFVDTATGGLSEEGKTFVERALLGSVVDDPRLMDATPKSVLNKLDGSLAALASISPRTDAYNILPLIRQALREHVEAARKGVSIGEHFGDSVPDKNFGRVKQEIIFQESFDPAVGAVARLLAEKPSAVKQRLRRFSEDANFDVQGQATLGMFEQSSPAKAFNEAFGANLTDPELENSIVRAVENEPIMGSRDVEETPTIGSPEASAGSLQRSPSGEPRPSGEGGTAAPEKGERESQAGGQLENFIGDEAGTFEPGKLAAPVAEAFKQDVAPALAKAGIGLKDTAAFFVSAIYPRIEETSLLGKALDIGAPTEAVDALMKLKGDRARAMAEFDGILRGLDKMFDRMPEAERIEFIDRMQTGRQQRTPELRQIATAIQTIQAEQRFQEHEAVNLGRPPSQVVKLPEKENYFHNRWDTPPGGGKVEDEDTRVSRLFTPRRPLEGSKGYNKRQSYTLKSGMEAGGRPVTTNPIRLLRLRLEDGMKFVSARRTWDELGKLGLREFVPRGERAPEGFEPINDRIARVYFPAELASGKTALVEGGRWMVEANTARLLNNMLSPDRFRGNPAGAGLMWLKNASTALELGLSPFHAVFETIEAASSQLSLGMLRSYNLGVRGLDAHEFATGLRQMLEAPIAPITMAREGAALPAYIEARARLEKIGVTEFGHKQIEGEQPHGVLESLKHFQQVRRDANIQRLLKRYPDLDQLIDDMFTGGMVIGQHQDYQVKILGKTAMESWTAGNPLGAVVRAVPTVLQGVMKPLFQWYIPNLKYSLFLRLMSEQAAEHAADLESGVMTRAELARKVVDSVENRFGEMTFNNLFWNRTFKTSMQFAFRSVTWKLGNVREIGGGATGQAKELGRWAWQAHELLGGEGEPPKPPPGEKIPFPEPESEKPGPLPKLDARASWVVSLLLTAVAMGTIASKALSKKYPWEWTEEELEGKAHGSWDWFRHMYRETIHPRTGETDSRGKPVRISLPSYVKEIEHASQDPRRYVVGSFSTILSKAIDIEKNEDYWGNYVFNPNAPLGAKARQIGRYAFPEPFVSSSFRRGKDVGEGKTALLGAFGFPRAPSDVDFTPAERMVSDMLKAGKHRYTPEETEEYQKRREALKKGEGSRIEMRRYHKALRLSWLQREVKPMEYKDALKVYDVANEDEKHALHHIMRVKKHNDRHNHGHRAEAEEEAAQP